MEMAMIGLGRMGAYMASRLIQGGHRVVAFDRDPAAVAQAAAKGAAPMNSLDAVVARLRPPRIAWIMVPAGAPVDETITSLLGLFEAGDIIVDGGNSNFNDSLRRAELVKSRGIHFVDVGTSGGVWGAKNGYSLMIGGDVAPVETLRPLFETLAPAADLGWAHLGPAGAGHFAKMVHNGIEYGAMQAYAEGFALLEKKKEFGFDLAKVASVWQHGSVIRSWLLDLTADALTENPTLAGIAPHVADSGEGRWMLAEAVASDVPCPVTASALIERIRSRTSDSFGNKLLSVMRNKFGGHEMKKEN
jgi:6-phosphogluconate dehydrogenase